MRIDLNALFGTTKSALPSFRAPTIIQPRSPAAFNSPATVVRISDAARQTASVDKATTSDSIAAAAELRDLVKRYDFRSITPTQMSALAGELRKRGEISQDAACSFISVEMNTVIEMDPSKPIDMIAHFKMMQDTVENAALGDSSLAFGVAYRREASQALANVISFANSDRPHI
jgi:aldehyde:ferredoxin oxidoreductase